MFFWFLLELCWHLRQFFPKDVCPLLDLQWGVPGALISNPVSKFLQYSDASVNNTGLITETILSLGIQSINKGVKPKGQPTTSCLCFSLPTRTLIIIYFLLLSFTNPHTDLSPPSFISHHVCLAPRWCFFISSSLMSCSHRSVKVWAVSVQQLPAANNSR